MKLFIILESKLGSPQSISEQFFFLLFFVVFVMEYCYENLAGWALGNLISVWIRLINSYPTNILMRLSELHND